MEALAPKLVWRPLKGSQMLAISCPCHHILYEGTRGPGKTDAQLMFFRRFVGRGYGQFWRGIIFDREYKNLDDLITKSKRWFPLFGDGAKWHESKADYKWTWPTGEELLFRQIKKANDYWNYHGHEYPFIGWNELTKFPTSELYDTLMSCNRTSYRPEEHPIRDERGNVREVLPPIPLVVFATTNPYGPGHNWVKRKFIDIAKPGQVLRRVINVFNPRTQQREDITKTQVRIFGSYKENIYLPPEYIAELESEKNKNRRKAWLWGDWDIVAGGALDDVWDNAVHLVPRFKVPANWKVDRSLDWGSSHPFSVGWWAEANGEEVELPNGRVWCPQPGSLIRISEWYGSEEIGTNVGLKMSATEVAKGIVKREQELLDCKWISKKPVPGPADNSIWEVDEKETDSIGSKMEAQKVYWTRSDKKPGSRKNGLQLMRDRLEASTKREGPGLYFTDNCFATQALLPVIPRDPDDPDDVDTDAEDHLYDDVRYRVLAGNNRYAGSVKVKWAS